MNVSFSLTGPESDLVDAIVQRLKAHEESYGDEIDVLHHRMNLAACHANGNPLRLQDLLEADTFNFAHDIWGIDHNLCRETGKLRNDFHPRFSQKGGAA